MMIESFLEAGDGSRAGALREKLPPPPSPPEGYNETEARQVAALFCNRFELDGKPFCQARFFREGDGGVRLEVERPPGIPWGEFMALLVFCHLRFATGGDLALDMTGEGRDLEMLVSRLSVNGGSGPVGRALPL